MFSFRTRIFCSVLAVALLSIGIAVFYGKSWLEHSQLQAARERLLHETRLAGVILDKLGPDPDALPELARILNLPDERLSLLDGKGNVLADTAVGAQPVDRLDNHADRPEVREALSGGGGADGEGGGQGFAIRPSGTLDLPLAYAVTRLDDGRLLRLAVPLENLKRQIESRLTVFSQIGLITVALSLLLAMLLSTRRKYPGTLRAMRTRPSVHSGWPGVVKPFPGQFPAPGRWWRLSLAGIPGRGAGRAFHHPHLKAHPWPAAPGSTARCSATRISRSTVCLS